MSFAHYGEQLRAARAIFLTRRAAETFSRYAIAQLHRLEMKFGYDTKHAMHLLRLLRMGREILAEGKVRVLRPDAMWLLEVRDGLLSYEELLDLAKQGETELAQLMTHSPLPEEPDNEAAEKLVIELHEKFLQQAV